MNIEPTTEIAIWPDNEWAFLDELEEFSHKSDDYRIRQAAFCPVCYRLVVPDYNEPTASCDCGTMEWYH